MHPIQQHHTSTTLLQTYLIAMGWICQIISIKRIMVVQLFQCWMLAALRLHYRASFCLLGLCSTDRHQERSKV